jgi:hypothetical protein
MRSGILLQSGQFYDYLEPEKNCWEIEDVALALSNQSRYAGHVDKFFSIAQHCVFVSEIIDPAYALDGLLHDASEAFLTDLPSPLKALLKDYRELEKIHEKEIFRRYNLEYPMRPEVHIADREALLVEVLNFKPPSEHWDFLDGTFIWDVKLKPWSPKKAREEFLKRYYELTNQRYMTTLH